MIRNEELMYRLAHPEDHVMSAPMAHWQELCIKQALA